MVVDRLAEASRCEVGGQHWEVRFLRSSPLQARALEGALTWLYSFLLAYIMLDAELFLHLWTVYRPVAMLTEGRIRALLVVSQSQRVALGKGHVRNRRGRGSRVQGLPQDQRGLLCCGVEVGGAVSIARPAKMWRCAFVRSSSFPALT